MRFNMATPTVHRLCAARQFFDAGNIFFAAECTANLACSSRPDRGLRAVSKSPLPTPSIPFQPAAPKDAFQKAPSFRNHSGRGTTGASSVSRYLHAFETYLCRKSR
ncbi:uncharacterized protein LOC142584515 [Dermacentor variabilis]|uniref:uncharacterized protein LOC142584515 n=1 Tax=Dermacentor variabilis TaxID=34621 RepID=UPI003F5AF8B0